MPQVVPAILEASFEEVSEKVQRIKPHADFVQLDVMDGVFVGNTTFNDPNRIEELDIDMEVHLMIDKPSLFIPKWTKNSNVKRVIIHFEATNNLRVDCDLIKSAGKEVGLAINPETSTYEIKEYLDVVDMVVIMGVDPGFSGQDFHKDVLEKIKEVKKWSPDTLVEVDGGINDYTKKLCAEAGADIIASASYIWNADNIEHAIAELAR